MGQRMVSAIMPTGGRPNYVRHAIDMFLGQTWQNKELIIVDDSLPDRQLPYIHDRRIRHIRLHDPMQTSAKHDLALGLAMGDYICYWDDDDWYSPRRFERQVHHLNVENADFCGIARDLVLFNSGKWARIEGPWEDLASWIGNSAMSYSRYNFHDGTAMFRRVVLRNIPRHGWMDVSQKTFFLNELANRNCKFVDLPNENDFVYIRHGDNAWQPNWSKCLKDAKAPDWFPEKEFEFYTKTKAF
jgi:glycosyltransferase involved in cell wall biosynthesis